MSDLGKRAGRAHFLMGELILADPEIWALVRPIIESRLDDLGSGREVIDDYPDTIAQIERLKKLLKQKA